MKRIFIGLTVAALATILVPMCFNGEGNLFVSDGALTEASFLFTLKFDDAGNWKIVKTHQMSKKELEEEQ